jgi:hypothetical protein
MVKGLIKKISKGSRFNQIYLQKNEGIGFEPGKSVVITPLEGIIAKEPAIFEYNVKLESLKKEIVKLIFKIIDSYGHYDNIIITGSFLDKGFNFEDIDIIIINPKNMEKEKLKNSIEENTGIKPHLILIDSESFNRGIRRDPLFRLIIDRYVSAKRTIFRKDREINYKLLDIYLLKNKNLIEGYDLFSIKQRKKLLRDFISIKLFSENKEVTIKNIEKEINKLFSKDIIENLFYYGNNEEKHEFIAKLKKEFNKLEKHILKNVSKQA